MSPRWSEWSPWAWDDAQARYWRARQDTQGNVEYDFSTPRGGNVGDDLAESFSNVNLGGQEDLTYTQGDAYTHGTPIAADGSATASGYGPSYAQSQYVQPQPAYPAKGKGRPKANHKEGHRDKGAPRKNRPKPAKNFDDDNPEGPAGEELDPFYRRRGGVPPEPAPVSNAAYAAQQGYAEPEYGAPSQDAAYAPSIPQTSDADPRYGQESSTYSGAEPQSTSPGQYDRHDYGSGSGGRLPGSAAEDESTYSEHHGHHGYAPGAGGRVPESAAAEDPPPEEQSSEYYSTTSGSLPQDSLPQDIRDAIDPYGTGSVDDHAIGESSSMASAHTYAHPPYEPEGRETPRPYAQPTTASSFYQHSGGAAGSVVTGGESDINSVSCVVEPSSKFRPGEVFKIMWCEPRGGGPPNRSEILTQRVRVDHGSGSIYQGLRRFIVVANDEGHCTCVPILTYERQGCNKRGVKALKHGIVYQNGKRPRMLQGEPELGFEAVRVNLTERTEQLVKESRVNYAKLTTIEHNFPVFFIGRVEPADFRNIVRPAVDTCWQRKRHNNY